MPDFFERTRLEFADEQARHAHAIRDAEQQQALRETCFAAGESACDFSVSKPSFGRKDLIAWAGLLAKWVEASRQANIVANLSVIAAWLRDPDFARGHQAAGHVLALAIANVDKGKIADKLATIDYINGLRDGLYCALENQRIGGPFPKSNKPDKTSKPTAAKQYAKSGDCFADLYAGGMTDAQIVTHWQSMTNEQRKAICPNDWEPLVTSKTTKTGNQLRQALAQQVLKRRERAAGKVTKAKPRVKTKSHH